MTKIPNSIWSCAEKKLVLCVSTPNEIWFEFSHHKISATGIKVYKHLTWPPLFTLRVKGFTKHRAWLRKQRYLLTPHCYRQKFQIYDVNQYLRYKSDCHGGPNENLFDFMFLLDDYGFVFFCKQAPAKLKCFF